VWLIAEQEAFASSARTADPQNKASIHTPNALRAENYMNIQLSNQELERALGQA
jgi:hypothetical protein